MTMFKAIFLVFCLCLRHVAIAQTIISPCVACDYALKKDSYRRINTFEQLLTTFDSINETNYEEVKRQISIGISIPIPVVKEIIGTLAGSSDFKDFQTRYRIYKETHSLLATSASLNSIDINSTNSKAYPYWNDCMAKCLGTPVSYALFDTTTNISVKLKYLMPAQGRRVIRIKEVITVNNVARTSIERLATNSTLNITVGKVFDETGKSRIKIELQPVESDGLTHLFDAFSFEDEYFKPAVAVSLVMIKYQLKDSVDKKFGPFWSQSQHEHSCFTGRIGHSIEDACNAGFLSCDGKWVANDLRMKLHADGNYFFKNISNKSTYHFDCEDGGNGSRDWNLNSLNNNSKCREHLVRIFKTNNVNDIELQVLTGSKEANFYVTKTIYVDLKQNSPLHFDYLSKDKISFFIPNQWMKNDFEITIYSSRGLLMVVNKNNLSKFLHKEVSDGQQMTIPLLEAGFQPFNLTLN